MPTSDCDAIVIGAGHNGLTCACYLARAGLRVLVLEANDDIGGLTITREITRPGFVSDLHAFGWQFASLSPAPEELGLLEHLELRRPDVAFAHAFPDGRAVHMHADLDTTCAGIARYSAHDADQWRSLFATWRDAKDAIRGSFNAPPAALSAHLAELEHAPGGLEQYRFSMQSLRSWSREWFEEERIRLFLGAFSLHANVAPDEAGGGQLAWLFDSVLQDYGNRVVTGGMANVPRALARILAAHGGEIRTGARVRRIVVEGGRARAVELDDGDVVTVSSVVASSADPRTLVFDLLGHDVVGDEIARAVDHYEWGDSIVVVYLALDRPPEFRAGDEPSRACYVHCTPPSLEYVAQMFAEARSGLLPAGPVMVVCNDGVADPSRVPPGKGLVKVLVKCVPYEIAGDATGRVTGRTWDDAKEAYADHVIEILSRDYVPDLQSYVIDRVVHSPLDQEQMVSTAVRGTELQGAFVPYQSGPMRPVPQLAHYRTPVPNVYLCGSGSHPGPGVSFMPGRNAALVIGADLGIDGMIPGGHDVEREETT